LTSDERITLFQEYAGAAGMWTLALLEGDTELKSDTFDMTALVIPESPIGMIALVIASLGSLGAYVKLRK
jgi:hypothetical protein